MGKKLSPEEILQLINNKNLKYLEGNLDSRKEKITLQCLKCGFTYQTTVRQIIVGKGGCRKCSRNLKLSNEKAKQRFKEKGFELLSEYKNMHSKVKVKCLKCNNIYETTPANILVKKRNCRYCSIENKKLRQKLKIQEINDRFNDKNLVLLSDYTGVKDKVMVKCLLCGKEYETTPDSVFNSLVGCRYCGKKDPLWEQDLAEFFTYFGLEVIRNYKFDGNYEIDIYLPSVNLGIELNGLYWHSFSPYIKNSFYGNENKCKWHLYKKKMLGLKHNIDIIFIYEHEFYNQHNFNKIISYILSKIGIYDNIIYARNCQFVEVSHKEANEFYDKYHLIGKTSPAKHYGLIYNDELISLMSIKKYNQDGDWIITRYSIKDGIMIIGGFKKLFKNTIKTLLNNNYEINNIYTFIDLRFVNPNDNVFIRNGFIKDEEVEPRYFYWKNSPRKPNEFKILDRIHAQKKNLSKIFPKFDEKLTENENVFRYYFGKCYDVGKIRLKYKVN